MNPRSQVIRGRSRAISSALAALGLLAFLVLVGATTPEAARARELRLQKVSARPPFTASSGREEWATASPASVRWMRGTLRVDGPGRVTVGEEPVRVTRSTGIYPLSEHGFADLETLDGRDVVVMGRVLRSGTKALLLMVSAKESVTTRLLAPQPDPDIVPSEVDPRVGVYEEPSPR